MTRFEERKKDFFDSLERLEDALKQPINEFVKDSIIQRFEFCFATVSNSRGNPAMIQFTPIYAAHNH